MNSIYGKTFNSHVLSESHKKIISLIGTGKKVLELGCSSGYLTQLMKDQSCVVDIVEQNKEDFNLAKKYARYAYCGSLDTGILKQLSNKYDVVVIADVLEHLKNPEELLRELKRFLKKESKIILSLPNIACWEMRKKLFFQGDFTYQEMGILDRTHLRFYTFYSIQDIIKQYNYKIINIFPMELSFPFMNSIRKLKFLGTYMNNLIQKILIRKYPNLIIKHLVIEVNSNE